MMEGNNGLQFPGLQTGILGGVWGVNNLTQPNPTQFNQANNAFLFNQTQTVQLLNQQLGGNPVIANNVHLQAPGSPSGGVLPDLTSNLPSHQLLNEIHQLQMKQKEKLEKMRHIQKQVMMNPQKQTYDMLDTQQKVLKSQIESELKALHQLSQQVILPPNEIHRLLFLQQDLRIQQTQLELFHQELQQLTQPHVPTCVAALVIVEDSFPLVITKGKQLDDDPVVVQLLSGANVEFQSFTKVKVAMVCENQQGKANNQKTIENDTQTMDVYRRIVKWHLKFLNGTRKNPVNLRFGMQVQIAQGAGSATVTIESNNSQPLIVITNECQWEESEGVLIKKDAFGELQEIPWAHFANVLQRHFLRATRQDPVRPTRSLSFSDFEYLNQKFFGGQDMISQKSFENFWAWFGKGIQKLRYQRHICPLWQTGLIHGFVSREYVEEALINQEIGTFLIRFSERHPGLFAVAYRIDESDPKQQVRHYLVRPDDTAGAKKTLPDFLSEQPSFIYLLQVTPDADGKVSLRKFAKHSVLEPYISKRSSIPATNGYDDGISAVKSGNAMIE